MKEREIAIKKSKLISPYLNGKKLKILILGCGPCYEGMHLKKLGHYLVGVDIDKKILRKAKKYCNKTYHLDLRKKLPFNNKEFDVIIAFEIIEHLGPVNLFLKECNRVLKASGLFILSTLSQTWWKYRIKAILGQDILSDLHIRLFTPKSLVEKLINYNFKIEKIKGLGILGFLTFVKFPFFSLVGNFIVIAKKTD